MVEVSHQACSARRRRALIGCAAGAASLALHAVLWSLLRAPPEALPRARPVAASSVRWLNVTLRPTSRAAKAAPQHAAARTEALQPRTASAARSGTPRAARRARGATAAIAVSVSVAPIAALAPALTPADGSVFGLPRVGYDDAVRAQGVRGFATAVAPPAAAPFDNNEALRRQIVEHISRQLGLLPPSLVAGRCTVQGADDTQLLCDSDDLHARLSNHAGPLAKLMAAYLRSGPGADPLAIEWRDGRYRLSAP